MELGAAQGVANLGHNFGRSDLAGLSRTGPAGGVGMRIALRLAGTDCDWARPWCSQFVATVRLDATSAARLAARYEENDLGTLGRSNQAIVGGRVLEGGVREFVG